MDTKIDSETLSKMEKAWLRHEDVITMLTEYHNRFERLLENIEKTRESAEAMATLMDKINVDMQDFDMKDFRYVLNKLKQLSDP